MSMGMLMLMDKDEAIDSVTIIPPSSSAARCLCCSDVSLDCVRRRAGILGSAPYAMPVDAARATIVSFILVIVMSSSPDVLN